MLINDTESLEKEKDISMESSLKELNDLIQNIVNIKESIEKEIIKIDKLYDDINLELTNFFNEKHEILINKQNQLKEQLQNEVTKVKEKLENFLSDSNRYIKNGQNIQKGDYGYLFCHMSELGEYTAFAISRDGYNYEDIIGGKAIMDVNEHARIEGGQRDAYITRSYDGKGFVMVNTDMCVAKTGRWTNYGIDLLKSDDLIHWTSVTFDFRKGVSIFMDPESPSVYKDFSTISRVWAPQIFWDPNYEWGNGDKGGYFVYYSMANWNEEGYDRMYYSYADKSFTQMTQPKLLLDWGYATIDADINLLEDGLYHMLIKKEGGKPGIFTTTSKYLTHGWGEPVDDDYVSFEGNKLCEGSSAFQLIGEKTWIVAYIQYSDNPKHYRLCKADENLRNFHDPVDIQGVTGPQHGSFMRLTEEEYKNLKKWSDSQK